MKKYIPLYTNDKIENVPRGVRHIGVLPYTYSPYNKEILFLLGREHYESDWKSALKYGPFGGSPEKTDKSAQDGASRECYEESMGFLGSKKDIYNMVTNTKLVFKSKRAIIYPIFIKFDPNISKIYSDVYKYLNRCMKESRTQKNYIPSCPDGYLEKISISYFTVNDILAQRKIMREEWYEFFVQVVTRFEPVKHWIYPDNNEFVQKEQIRTNKMINTFYPIYI